MWVCAICTFVWIWVRLIHPNFVKSLILISTTASLCLQHWSRYICHIAFKMCKVHVFVWIWGPGSHRGWRPWAASRFVYLCFSYLPPQVHVEGASFREFSFFFFSCSSGSKQLSTVIFGLWSLMLVQLTYVKIISFSTFFFDVSIKAVCLGSIKKCQRWTLGFQTKALFSQGNLIALLPVCCLPF